MENAGCGCTIVFAIIALIFWGVATFMKPSLTEARDRIYANDKYADLQKNDPNLEICSVTDVFFQIDFYLKSKGKIYYIGSGDAYHGLYFYPIKERKNERVLDKCISVKPRE